MTTMTVFALCLVTTRVACLRELPLVRAKCQARRPRKWLPPWRSAGRQASRACARAGRRRQKARATGCARERGKNVSPDVTREVQ